MNRRGFFGAVAALVGCAAVPKASASPIVVEYPPLPQSVNLQDSLASPHGFYRWGFHGPLIHQRDMAIQEAIANSK